MLTDLSIVSVLRRKIAGRTHDAGPEGIRTRVRARREGAPLAKALGREQAHESGGCLLEALCTHLLVGQESLDRLDTLLVRTALTLRDQAPRSAPLRVQVHQGKFTEIIAMANVAASSAGVDEAEAVVP